VGQYVDGNWTLLGFLPLDKAIRLFRCFNYYQKIHETLTFLTSGFSKVSNHIIGNSKTCESNWFHWNFVSRG
jgi:hypothetical protein